MKKANDEFEIKVYDENENVVKTCKAQAAKIRFGVIRKLMALLAMDDINDTASLLKTIYGAWEQVTKILGKCFPDMTEEDWDNVLFEDVIPVVYGIAQSSFTKMLSIPKDPDSSKN